jgi:membrane associated rhomboid family serine protease
VNFSINLFVIALTVLISIGAFNDAALRQKLLLYPAGMRDRNEWYRFITSGFIHGDWLHLIMNMIVLYYFGEPVEYWLNTYYPGMGRLMFIMFYVLAIAVANISSVVKNLNNPGYGSLGASGAVAAMLFASIIWIPGIEVAFIFFPVPIPGYLFGVLYIIYSVVMARRGRDLINHEAHIYGALFGFTVASVMAPELFIEFLNYFANLL